VARIQSQASGLEADAFAIVVNLAILDAKVIIMSRDISDLESDVSRKKPK
jgi:hypothetical protein